MRETPGDPIFLISPISFWTVTSEQGGLRKWPFEAAIRSHLRGSGCRRESAGNGLLRLGLQTSNGYCYVADCPEFAAAYFGVIKIGAGGRPDQHCCTTCDYDYFLRESQSTSTHRHSTLFGEVVPALGAAFPPARSSSLADLSPDTCIGMSGSPRIRPNWSCKGQVPRTSRLVVGPRAHRTPKAAVHLHYDGICCCRNMRSKSWVSALMT